MLLGLGMSTLLGGCYQVCPSYDRMPLQNIAPRATDGPSVTPSEQDSTFAGLDRPYGETVHTYGEVWTIPSAAESDADGSTTSSVPGSNAPWTAVVYTQSAFVLAEDEPLEGTLTLHIGRDGTISASLPRPSAGRAAADTQRQPNHGHASDSTSAKEERSSYRWLKRFSGLGNDGCESPTLTPKRETNTDDLLRVQFMLARTPQSAGGLAVFGVQVRGNGRDFNHSQIVNSAEKTFNAEFGDVAAAANTTAAAGLRVFRINITAQRVEGHVILPGSEGRLIDAKFDPQGHMLYVVNLGFVLQDDRGRHPSPRTGALLVDATAGH
jgi:hypothetical protein